MIRLAVAVMALVLVPGAAAAHDAFGDLGPFYAALLHPLADPSQGLIVAAVGVLLARQSLETVRPAYAAFVASGAASVLAGAVAPHPAPGLALVALGAAGFGIAALAGLQLGRPLAVALAGAAGLAAGLAVDLPPGWRAGGLAALGGTLGLALGSLLIWGLVDLLQRRLGRGAGAVAASWIAAVGVMAAAFDLSGAL
jgi:hypothetical protein